MSRSAVVVTTAVAAMVMLGACAGGPGGAAESAVRTFPPETAVVVENRTESTVLLITGPVGACQEATYTQAEIRAAVAAAGDQDPPPDAFVDLRSVSVAGRPGDPPPVIVVITLEGIELAAVELDVTALPEC